MQSNQSLNSKFSTVSRASAEVTDALGMLGAAAAREVFTSIRALEAGAVAAASAKKFSDAAVVRANRKTGAARTHLRKLNAFGLSVCSSEEIVSAEALKVMDNGDEVSLAQRLAPELKKVFGAGPSELLLTLSRKLESEQAKLDSARAVNKRAASELALAIIELQAGCAQGRLVLGRLGVMLKRKPARKKSANNNTEQPANAGSLSVTPVVTAA